VPPGRRVARLVRARLRDIPALRNLVVRGRHRGIAPEDAFLVAYPKAGSTWLSGLLAHLATGREFSFDDAGAVTPMVGDHRRAPSVLPNGGKLLRSHEQYVPAFGGRYGRVVYMVRDGRDTVVSYYHHHLRIGEDPGSIGIFLERFLAGTLDGWGSWPVHVRSWLDSPQAQNGTLRIVRYEDLRERPEEELTAVARFLSLPSGPDAIRAALEAHSVERMRERERQTAFHRQFRRDMTFVRRATIGEHAEVLTPEQLERFEEAAGAEQRRLGYGVGSNRS